MLLTVSVLVVIQLNINRSLGDNRDQSQKGGGKTSRRLDYVRNTLCVPARRAGAHCVYAAISWLHFGRCAVVILQPLLHIFRAALVAVACHTVPPTAPRCAAQCVSHTAKSPTCLLVHIFHNSKFQFSLDPTFLRLNPNVLTFLRLN